jgi:arsenite methyltransferase
VLDNAELMPGETLLDVGTGTGLIALGALERTGAAGRIIFSDISSELLDHCQRAAKERGALARSTFVHAPANDLSAIGDGSVDVVTTRSVLIYVADKRAAFAEFYRVLRPGGRLSVFEPINRYFQRRDRMLGFDLTGIEDLADCVLDVYDRLQPPGMDPMLSFGERDLIELAERAGFEEVHMELSVDVHPTTPTSWGAFVDVPPNPLVPSLAEAAAQVLTPDEAERFEAHLRPLVEAGRGVERLAVGYLRARKSAAN